MKKMKQISAIIVVVFLLSLYLLTFIGALTASKYSAALFQASLYSTVVIPIMIYLYMFVYRLLKKDSKDSTSLKDKEKLK